MFTVLVEPVVLAPRELPSPSSPLRVSLPLFAFYIHSRVFTDVSFLPIRPEAGS